MRVLKRSDGSRDPSVSNFHTFPWAKLQNLQKASAADDCKTQVKVRILTDFLACLRPFDGCMFEAGPPAVPILILKTTTPDPGDYVTYVRYDAPRLIQGPTRLGPKARRILIIGLIPCVPG